jgi:hypothetical protein
MTNNDKLSERLNLVENQVVSIGTKVENLQSDIAGLVLSFNTYVEATNKADRTDWATIGVWIGIAFICVSALLYHTRLTLIPVELTNKYQQKEIDRQSKDIEALRQHATSDSAL